MTTLATLSSGTIIAIVLVVLFDIFVIVLAVSFLRARRAARAMEEEAAAGGTLTPAVAEGLPVTKEPKAPKLVSRRAFLKGWSLAGLGLFTAVFGAATIAFLWPNLRGGFGSKFTVGSVDEIKSQIDSTGQPFYYGRGRFYIVKYTGTGIDEALDVDYAKEGVLVDGLMPLYQRCVHLGCRVPFCQSSQWFECPCHGSKYSGVGEYKLGPAPHGMDRFKISLAGDQVVVDTSSFVLGPPRGTDTTNQSPQGPFCV